MNTSVGNRDGNYASHLSHLKADNGAIFQEDDKTLTIDKYSGTGKLFYRHTGDGTRPEDYAGGDTHIKKADAGSSITVVTDRENVDTANEDKVYKVLNSLAGKLYYEDAKNDKTDLTQRDRKSVV